MRAASLSGGRWAGVPGSDVGTGAQAFSMMDHLAGRPMPKGGSGMLSVALGRFIEAHNGVTQALREAGIVPTLPAEQAPVETKT